MKRAWLSLAIIAGISVSGFCASPKTDSTASGKTAAASVTTEERDQKVEDLITAMTVDLKLSKAQQEDIRKELTKAKADYIALHKEMAERMKALLDGTNGRIAANLKPDQKKKFEAANGIDAQGHYTPPLGNGK